MSQQGVSYSSRRSSACMCVCVCVFIRVRFVFVECIGEGWSSASFLSWSDLDAWELNDGGGEESGGGGGTERCNISLSSLLSCGFPLGPDAPLRGAYSSTPQPCFVCLCLSRCPLLSQCRACVYTGSDTRTTPGHSFCLTPQSCSRREI